MMGCDLVAIVDDDDDLRAAIVQTLELEGLRTRPFDCADRALAALDRGFAGIVITDLRMPGLDGRGLFERLSAIDADLPVVVITGHGDIPTAVELMGRGVYDFIPKPFSPERLVPTVRRALEKRALVMENRNLQDAAEMVEGHGFAGTSAHAHDVRAGLRTLARAARPVLLEGEPGTGKTLCAGLLHRLSGRSRFNLITIDCSSLGEEDGQIAICGHVAGLVPGAHQPRTGAVRRADRGTLVLDGVDRLPLSLQRLVERIIESGTVVPVGGDAGLPVDVAIVATAGPGLADRVEEGLFSSSLFLRLSGGRLMLRPLRERPEDVAGLFGLFLKDAVEAASVPFPVVSPDILARLRAGPFAGNAHEIRALAEASAFATPGASRDTSENAQPDSLRAAVSRYEAEHIRQALRDAGGDVEIARARLDLPRKTLYDKLARHGIVAAHFRRG